jgi:hypothetical protein
MRSKGCAHSDFVIEKRVKLRVLGTLVYNVRNFKCRRAK